MSACRWAPVIGPAAGRSPRTDVPHPFKGNRPRVGVGRHTEQPLHFPREGHADLPRVRGAGRWFVARHACMSVRRTHVTHLPRPTTAQSTLPAPRCTVRAAPTATPRAPAPTARAAPAPLSVQPGPPTTVVPAAAAAADRMPALFWYSLVLLVLPTQRWSLWFQLHVRRRAGPRSIFSAAVQHTGAAFWANARISPRRPTAAF